MLFGDDDERFSLKLIYSASGLNRMDWYDSRNSSLSLVEQDDQFPDFVNRNICNKYQLKYSFHVDIQEDQYLNMMMI